MEKNLLIREAKGDFPFHFWIEKATAEEVNGQMVVQGVASTSNVDHDKERMSPEALKAMAEVVNKTGVPLRIEHSQADHAIVGTVNKGWIDDRGQFWIQAALDPTHVAAPLLYKALKAGEKYGLSVGGFVKRAAEEMVEGAGQLVKTFYDIVLDEVSVTQHPSNYDAIGLKAIKSIKEPTTDYLEAFAKSIPANEWHRVSKDYKFDNSNHMAKKIGKDAVEDEKDEKETKAADDKEEAKDEDMEKSVSRSDFNQLVKAVGQMGNAFTSVLSKLAKDGISVEAKDEEQPNKNKDESELEEPTNKSGEALDEEQPKKEKEDPEGDKPVSKDAADGSDEDGKREDKAEDDDKKDEETYDLETVQRAIKQIRNVAKAMDDDKDKEE